MKRRTPKTALLAATTAAALCSLAILTPTASAAAPLISKTTLSHVTTTSVLLEAEIDPQGKETGYRFEYGAEDCSLNPCASTPEGKIEASKPAELVSVPLEGLTPEPLTTSG
jgi:hypothetical protein